MRNLLSLSQLTLEEIQELLDLSQQLKDHKIKSQLTNKKIANLFFEPSTRTHYSFITAQHNLNCHPIDFAPGTSSIIKGETFYDTVKVFESFGVDAIVIRHNENY
jgi:aspartate carbamoyltransferase catalytic subunit